MTSKQVRAADHAEERRLIERAIALGWQGVWSSFREVTGTYGWQEAVASARLFLQVVA